VPTGVWGQIASAPHGYLPCNWQECACNVGLLHSMLRTVSDSPKLSEASRLSKRFWRVLEGPEG